MKFSIVVPVYNVENYILKCLESIENQSYKNYETIIVNDGSLDNSETIIKKYIKGKRNFKYYKKPNGGLSDARNYGLTYATGDYILFVDSDDYIEKDLLKKINEKIKKSKYDLIRYGLNLVDENGKLIKKVENINDKDYNKDEAIKAIITSDYVEPAWLYAYNKKFWDKFNFLYAKGKIHEDYGLTPIIFSKAKDIGFISYSGYNYVQRENSITSQIDYDKLKKRTMDFKEFYLEHKKSIKPNNKSNKLILSFSAEAMLYKTRELKGKDRDDMIKFLRQEKVIKEIYPITFKKRLQKIYLNLFLNHYITKISHEFYNSLGDKND